MWTALRERGLADVAGPEPGLDRFLRLLAAPSLRVEVRAWGALTIRAAVADADDDGVLARRHDDAVVLEACTSIPGAVVGLLASSPAGPGQAATVPGAQLEAALRRPSGAGLRADLVDRGVDREQAGLMARMLHGIDGRAQIAVLVPDRWGVLQPFGRARGGAGRAPRALPDDPHPERRRHLVDERRSGRRPPTTAAPRRAARAGRSAQSRSPCRISCRPASVIEPDSDG